MCPCKVNENVVVCGWVYVPGRSPAALSAARAEVDHVLEQTGDPEQQISISREQLDSMSVLGKTYYTS